MKKEFLFLAVVLMTTVGLTACSDDDADEVTSDVETWEVTGILSPNGLGDLNYNDKVFLGLCYMRDSLKCHVVTYSPSNFDEAEEMANEWLGLKPSKNVHRLLVLCDSKYSDMVKANGWKNEDGKDILQCDVSDTTLSVYTRATLLYGACYVVGRMTDDISSRTDKRTALMLANDEDWAISEGATGFREGCGEAGINVDNYYLYEKDSRGYNVPDSAYHLCYRIAANTGFVMPLSGSSNNGVYRYGRDGRSDTIFTCVVDPFSFNYSTTSLYYFTMDMPRLLLQFAQNWKSNIAQPLHSIAGIESSLVKIYKPGIATDEVRDKFDEAKQEAVRRERKRYANMNLEIDKNFELE